jgi:hypothetical protein
MRSDETVINWYIRVPNHSIGLNSISLMTPYFEVSVRIIKTRDKRIVELYRAHNASAELSINSSTS